VAYLRRGQVFAISWRPQSEAAEASGQDREEFGLFLVDWFLDHNPAYKGPVKRVMGVRGLQITDNDHMWPLEWRMILDVNNITKIQRIQRSDFDQIW
jgi:hypothetical protein